MNKAEALERIDELEGELSSIRDRIAEILGNEDEEESEEEDEDEE